MRTTQISPLVCSTCTQEKESEHLQRMLEDAERLCKESLQQKLAVIAGKRYGCISLSHFASAPLSRRQ